jgi:putative phosphoesterase
MRWNIEAPKNSKKTNRRGNDMKVAFISDIHSNIEAFLNMLRYLKTKNVDQIYVAGDLLGYYYDAADVVDLCMSSDNILCIRGNHDRNFLAALSDKEVMDHFTSKYGSSFKKARDELRPAQIDWIQALPIKLDFELSGLRITVAHGSVTNEDEYIYPDATPEVFMDQVMNCDITVLGNTHYSFIWCKDNKYLINPGSVGQPRDQGSLASAVVLDTANRAIVPYRVKFDTSKLKKDIAKFDPGNKYLLTALERE